MPDDDDIIWNDQAIMPAPGQWKLTPDQMKALNARRDNLRAGEATGRPGTDTLHILKADDPDVEWHDVPKPQALPQTTTSLDQAKQWGGYAPPPAPDTSFGHTLVDTAKNVWGYLNDPQANKDTIANIGNWGKGTFGTSGWWDAQVDKTKGLGQLLNIGDRKSDLADYEAHQARMESDPAYKSAYIGGNVGSPINALALYGPATLPRLFAGGAVLSARPHESMAENVHDALVSGAINTVTGGFGRTVGPATSIIERRGATGIEGTLKDFPEFTKRLSPEQAGHPGVPFLGSAPSFKGEEQIIALNKDLQRRAGMAEGPITPESIAAAHGKASGELDTMFPRRYNGPPASLTATERQDFANRVSTDPNFEVVFNRSPNTPNLHAIYNYSTGNANVAFRPQVLVRAWQEIDQLGRSVSPEAAASAKQYIENLMGKMSPTKVSDFAAWRDKVAILRDIESSRSTGTGDMADFLSPNNFANGSSKAFQDADKLMRKFKVGEAPWWGQNLDVANPVKSVIRATLQKGGEKTVGNVANIANDLGWPSTVLEPGAMKAFANVLRYGPRYGSTFAQEFEDAPQ